MKKFLSLFFKWKVPVASSHELAKADVIITHEFGDQHTVSLTTEQIVELGIKVSKKYNIPLICQYPGDIVASSNNVTPLLVIKEHLLSMGKYLDTQEVNRQVAEICNKNGWKKVIICAHPDHAWRVGENLKTFWLVPLFPDLSGIQYDKDCSRLTLTSKWFFIPREIVARVLYCFKGWI